MKKTAAILIILLMAFAPAIAGTIYIWTDENGVKRFSDQLPEGVEEYETAVGSISSDSGEKREGLKQMLKEQEAQNAIDEAKAKEAAAKRKADEEQKAKAEQSAKVQAERERLQQQIDQVRKRAVSPTFTEGMRQHQINEIQKQIDALDKNQ